MKTLIFEEHNELELTCCDSPSDAFADQVSATLFGSSGLRYRRLDPVDSTPRLRNARYFELRRKGQLIGTYCLCPQVLEIGGTTIQGTYRGLLTVAPEYRSAGVGRIIVREALEWLRRQTPGAPQLSYGCIDSGNTRSIRLLQSLGAERLGELDSMLVYRQFTERHSDVVIVEDRQRIDAALAMNESDCGVRALPSLDTPFYSLCDGDNIVAGARTQLVRLNLAASGRLWPRFYGALIDAFPPARRRFDPREFRYVRLTDVVATDSSAAHWRRLLNDILDRHEAHMAMFVMDARRATCTALERAGLFKRFTRATRQRISVMGNTTEIDPELDNRLRSTPLAIGPVDI